MRTDKLCRCCSDEFGAELVVEPPHHATFVTCVAAVLDHKDELVSHLRLHEQPDAAVRYVRDQTLLGRLTRCTDDAAGAVHDLARGGSSFFIHGVARKFAATLSAPSVDNYLGKITI